MEYFKHHKLQNLSKDEIIEICKLLNHQNPIEVIKFGVKLVAAIID